MIGQISRFVGVGVLATLIHLTVALVVSVGLDAAPQAANGAGFLAAVAFSYLGHARLTFRVVPNHRSHAPRFVATALTGLGVSAGLTQIIAVWFGAPFIVAMLVVALAVPAATYVLCQLWVFVPTQPSGP